MKNIKSKKFIASLFSLSLLVSSTCFANEEAEQDGGLSKGQKWVLGLTGGALLATGAAKKRTYAQQGRKAIFVVGLVSFAGVSIYDHNNKKVALGVGEDGPILSYNMRF
ncbi:MAG: hypothetical protein K6L76_03350 [Agarilytica sp.]